MDVPYFLSKYDPDPLRFYLTCVWILRAHDDPHASEVLGTAYHILQERAARIEDEHLRHCYLENVPYHRGLVQEYSATAHSRNPNTHMDDSGF